MQLSIVIVCWDGVELIGHCLRSIFEGTRNLEFEVIVSDNGSTDGSVEMVRRDYPQVRLIENGSNLGYARGNNVAIGQCQGKYVLLLNSDTVVHEGALEKLVAFAEIHPEAGAFGCHVLNPDGSHQISSRPFPTLWRDWMDALFLPQFPSGQAHIWHSGCCVLFRADLLRQLGGFDEQFFYSYEDVDLCWRVWDCGYSVVQTSDARITHLGSQSANRSPVRFELERHRSRYRYFYKHYGAAVLRRCRNVALARIRIRQLAYGLLNLLAPSNACRQKLTICRAAAQWNRELDPVRFVEKGEQPLISSIQRDGLLQSSELLSEKK